MNLYPEKKVARNYKIKEHSVITYIKDNINRNWIHDRIIQGGYSKRRPDLFLDVNNKIIIIEIDENMHLDYDSEINNKRIMEISKDVGNRPIIFIRFNPDSYKKKNKRITSCWGVNNLGILVVKKIKEWEERLSVLKETVDYWLKPDNVSTKTVEIVYLFYDRAFALSELGAFAPMPIKDRRVPTLPRQLGTLRRCMWILSLCFSTDF